MKTNRIKTLIKTLVFVLLIAAFCISLSACFDNSDKNLVMFDSCEGSPRTQTVRIDDTFKVITPKKENLKFDGWFWDKDTWNEPFTLESVKDAKDNIVYAKWVFNGEENNIAELETDSAGPEVTNPEVTNPEVIDPENTNPEVTNPDNTNPEVTNPENTNPEVTNPDNTNPEVTNPSLYKLNAPANLQLRQNTSLTWDVVINANSYAVEIDGEVFNTSGIPQYNLPSLNKDKVFTFRVKAIGDGIYFADSDWSVALTFKGEATSGQPTSEGLAYKLVDGKTYTVFKGNATADRIIIPAIYNNLPVTAIEKQGFEYYKNLKSISIPDSVKTIGMFAFLYCTQLESIDIPDGLQTIDYYAFQDCHALKTVSVGKDVRLIQGNIFYGCSNIQEITVSSDNIHYKSDGNCLIRTTDNVLLTGCINSIIPNYVTMLGTFSFSHICGLENIVIPISVLKMGSNVFNCCENLKIYAEASLPPSGWGYSWNPYGRPVAYNYNGEPFDQVVFEKPYVDEDYDCIKFDIQNASCEDILIKYYTAYQNGEISVKTLTYATVIAFGRWAYGDTGTKVGIDNIIGYARERHGFALFGDKTLYISADTLKTVSQYWALIKPIILNELCSEGFSTKIFDESYPVTYYTLDFYIDKLIESAKNGNLILKDCLNYINAVYAVSYGKLDSTGPKLSSQIAC